MQKLPRLCFSQILTTRLEQRALRYEANLKCEQLKKSTPFDGSCSTLPELRDSARQPSLHAVIFKFEQRYLDYPGKTFHRRVNLDYQLENLGPERFQEVCLALIARSFPKTQCFPVAQRDGGRDAISFFTDSNNDGFIVFQVKYVRKPLSESAPHEWLKSIVEDEAPKVAKLIPKGAQQYILLTNVPGTAFPDAGAIDVVQQTFATHIQIPAQCWWRDDINRRLDDSPHIKWAYPEILSGPDVLRYIVESGLPGDSERRTNTIRAFVRDQFERDVDVRFKQVELQNKLLDLFIDVPLSLRDVSDARKSQEQMWAFRSVAHEHSPDSSGRNLAVGAATLGFVRKP
jgi:hypothetical protein